MDESLQLTQQMKDHIEGLTARQSDAIRKMKDSKSAVQKLRDQVGAMQQQIDAVQNERQTSSKATADLKGEIDKLENEHAVLHATHTWTKSSLDSALAAQEEYRKGYNSLRAAFKKAKEELEKSNEDLLSSKACQEELDKARAVLDDRKAVWDKELDAVNATLHRIARKHKDKSKAVLNRMLAGQASGLMGTCLAAWVAFLKDWKKSEKARDEVEATKAKLSGFQSKKSEEAKQFLNRMSAASDTGLISVVWKAWLSFCAEVFKERKDADMMASTLKNQKLEARKKLEATLGENMRGMQGLVFKNWAQSFKEEKEERELRAQADSVMAEYKRKKKSQSLQVVDRMATKKENALLEQVVLVWRIIVTSDVAQRYREAEARKRLETISAEIAKSRAALAGKKELLEDAQEELGEVKRKNQVMRDQLKQIMDMEDNMESVQKQLDDD